MGINLCSYQINSITPIIIMIKAVLTACKTIALVKAECLRSLIISTVLKCYFSFSVQ